MYEFWDAFFMVVSFSAFTVILTLWLLIKGEDETPRSRETRCIWDHDKEA